MILTISEDKYNLAYDLKSNKVNKDTVVRLSPGGLDSRRGMTQFERAAAALAHAPRESEQPCISLHYITHPPVTC